jgi:molybdopterin-guanine dinucleotide biosynthesis protein A
MGAMNEAEVTLAILAGGRGERMGKAKALLRIGNQPILTYLLERFAWRGPTMLVSSPGREHPPGAEEFDVEVVDPVEGMGPVRGF